MTRRTDNDCVWVEGAEGYWLCSGGYLEVPLKVTPAELQTSFPIFCAAVSGFCEKTEVVSDTDREPLLGLAGLALTEKIPRRQRFQLYRAVALYLGYTDRTQLPSELEEAIRAQWAEPNEVFVGFQAS